MESVKYISEEDFHEINRRSKVSKGDILFAMIGTVGNPVIIGDDTDFAIKNLALFKNTFNLNSDYLNSWLQLYQKTILEQSSGGVQKFVSLKYLRALPVPLPPLAEQERIVDAIELMSLQIDKYKVAYEKLENLNLGIQERLNASILKYAMQGKLTNQREEDGSVDDLLAQITAEKEQLILDKKIKRDKALPPISEDEIPFQIPSNWKWARFTELITLISGRDLNASEYSSDLAVGIPYLTGASNFENGLISTNRYTSAPTVISQKGDLLITVKGTIGEMAFNAYPEAHIARQIMAIRTTSALNINFVRYVLLFEMSKLKQKANSMIPGISRQDLLEEILPLPPLEEQIRIVEKLDKFISINL
ncbi:hypothetical protein DWV22_10930 [Weissella confusa]|nr:hypothetical protein DWV22_10930 [Weissella confusa]